MCSTGFALSQEGTLAAALSKETKAPKKTNLVLGASNFVR